MNAFPNRPCKPQVTRLPDGRIGIFIGGAYQYTDDDGAESLRIQLDTVLDTPATFEQVDRDFVGALEREIGTRS